MLLNKLNYIQISYFNIKKEHTSFGISFSLHLCDDSKSKEVADTLTKSLATS
jgi:hypothetical protein